MPCRTDLKQATTTASVIGAGPAGLMAAEVLAQNGVRVAIYDAMPSAGRKSLMAGKGGLNITHAEAFDDFLARCTGSITSEFSMRLARKRSLRSISRRRFLP